MKECAFCNHGKPVEPGNLCQKCLDEIEALEIQHCHVCGELHNDDDLKYDEDGQPICDWCIRDGGGYSHCNVVRDYPDDLDR